VIIYDKEAIKNCNQLGSHLMGCEKDVLSSLQQRKTNGTSNGEIKTPNGMRKMRDKKRSESLNILLVQRNCNSLTYNFFSKVFNPEVRCYIYGRGKL
jgi:hypothetical protein